MNSIWFMASVLVCYIRFDSAALELIPMHTLSPALI